MASLLKSLRILDEEETTDNELKNKFKERWQRTPSNDLYKPLRAGNIYVVIVLICLLEMYKLAFFDSDLFGVILL